MCLTLVEGKILIVQRSITALSDNNDYFDRIPANLDFIRTMETVVTMPDQIKTVINWIEVVKTIDRVYIPQYEKINITRNVRFIPQSEQVT